MIALDALARHLMDSLEVLGIPHALTGGLASNVWSGRGHQYDTEDVDIAVLITEDQPLDSAELARELARRTGLDCLHASDVDLGDRMIVRLLCDGVVADLVLADAIYARQAIEGAGEFDLEGKTYRILEPEDVILYKSLARRRRDLLRIAAISEAQTLNRQYLEQWGRYLERWPYLSAALAGEGLEDVDLD